MKNKQLKSSFYLMIILFVFAVFSVKSQNIGNNVGYWKMTGITGLKEHSREESSGWSYKDKFSGDNSATFYSYTKQLEKQLQFSWSALPDIVKPNQEYPITIEGKQIFRNPRWEGSNSLCVGFTGAANLLGEVYVGAEGDKGMPMKKITILKVPEGGSQSRFFYVYFSLIGNFNPDTYTYVYEWIPISANPAINVDKATKKTIDSVITFDNGKAYIFSGNQYIRVDIALDRADSGYPKPLSLWGLPWTDGIDEAVNWGNGKVYIFKGSQYIRFDIKADRVDEGYPKSLSEWRLPWTDGIDAAVNWGNGKVYIFKGNQYIRFDIKSDRVDEGYPKPINNETWNGLQFFFE
jgi:hypothetical protein